MNTLRSHLKAYLIVCALLTLSISAVADDPSVPLRLQVDLTAKVMGYAQQPSVRAVDAVRVGILTRPGSAESTRVGAELKAAFDALPAIAGQAHEQSILRWSGVSNLVDEAQSKKLFLLYLTPGFEADVPGIARAFRGVQVITIAAVDDYVADGAILGFELVSGHPKMVFNMAQAKRQNVVFASSVMKLMRVVE